MSENDVISFLQSLLSIELITANTQISWLSNYEKYVNLTIFYQNVFLYFNLFYIDQLRGICDLLRGLPTDEFW